MGDPSTPPTPCALCGRAVEALTRHHLRPKAHGGVETVLLCSGCHRQVHALFTNRTLAAEYDSLEKLRADPAIQAYVRWAHRQHDRRFRVRKSRARR
ncbi:MAG: HNH endonuclease [Armatimonadota bacterium]